MEDLIEQSRKAFEKYLNPAQSGLSLQKYSSISPLDIQGHYVDNHVGSMWFAWKEAVKWTKENTI